MTAEHEQQMQRMRALYGAHPPPTIQARTPARVLSIRSTGKAALVLIEEPGAEVRLLRIERSDDHSLSVLSASDRARVCAAVATVHRAGGPHAA